MRFFLMKIFLLPFPPRTTNAPTQKAHIRTSEPSFVLPVSFPHFAGSLLLLILLLCYYFFLHLYILGTDMQVPTVTYATCTSCFLIWIYEGPIHLLDLLARNALMGVRSTEFPRKNAGVLDPFRQSPSY